MVLGVILVLLTLSLANFVEICINKHNNIKKISDFQLDIPDRFIDLRLYPRPSKSLDSEVFCEISTDFLLGTSLGCAHRSRSEVYRAIASNSPPLRTGPPGTLCHE